MRWLKRQVPEASAPPVTAAARPQALHTARLRLLPLRAEDTGELHRLWTAPGVRRHLWSDRVLRLEQTRDLVMQSGYLFEQRGYGLWSALDDGGEMVGVCGYWFFRNEHELELLYAVREDRWLRGYAREMAEAMVGYGFDALDLAELRASTEAGNGTSQRLLQRIGFVTDSERATAGGPRFYRLPRQRREGGAASWEAA